MWIILITRKETFSNAVCIRRDPRTGAESLVTSEKPIATLALKDELEAKPRPPLGTKNASQRAGKATSAFAQTLRTSSS
jgi:hypothetical protein